MAGKKEAKFGAEPRPAKEAKWASDPQLNDGGHLGWRFAGADRNGPFSWAALVDAGEYKAVQEKLHEFEKLNWAQIIATGSHPIPLDKLSKEARERLAAIRQDDIDELMSFRVMGEPRVWCIPHKNLMRVLWWDPKHQVCPWIKDPADRRKASNRR